MNILIVEDEKRLADALSHILLEQKYMVDVVYDGIEGLDSASKLVISVLCFKIDNNKCRLPVICVNYVGNILRCYNILDHCR